MAGWHTEQVCRQDRVSTSVVLVPGFEPRRDAYAHLYTRPVCFSAVQDTDLFVVGVNIDLDNVMGGRVGGGKHLLRVSRIPMEAAKIAKVMNETCGEELSLNVCASSRYLAFISEHKIPNKLNLVFYPI